MTGREGPGIRDADPGSVDLRWGSPPLALVPLALSGRLARPLPPWMADLLGGRGTPVGALTADAWSRLPDDEPTRRRIRELVASQVHRSCVELRDVPVGATDPPPRGDRWSIDADREHWALRSRVTLAAAANRAGGDGAPITFGDLLDVPGSGVVTALEVAALLELDGHAARGDLPASTPPVLRWRHPGCALLPRSARYALGDTILPPAVAGDLGLPAGATVGALDESVWWHAGAVSSRVERHLLALVAARPMRQVRVIADEWPATRRPEDVRWPKRLRGALGRAGLLDAARLCHVTYGDLLALPAVGPKSAIELGVIADAICPVDEGEELPAHAHRFGPLAGEPWTDRIRADDPRFADVLQPHRATLRAMLRHAAEQPGTHQARVLDRSIDAVRARAEEIGAEPLDRALPRLATALGISQRNLDVAADRLGWCHEHGTTLRGVAARHEMSRERVRQVVERVSERVRGAYLPQVERAADLLARDAPMTAADAAALLVGEGLAVEPLDPWSVLSLADSLGYPTAVQVDDAGGTRLVLPDGPVDATAVLQAARRATGRSGVARLSRVLAAVSDPDADGDADHDADALPRSVVTVVLRNARGVAFLDDEWFWLRGPPPQRNPLLTPTRRMLSLAGCLDVASIRYGIARHLRRPPDQLAPAPVLAAFFRDHPDFVVHGDVVASCVPLDWREVLRPGEQLLVRIVRDTPDGRLSRSTLQRAAPALGASADSLCALLATTPILTHSGYDAWYLCGTSALALHGRPKCTTTPGRVDAGEAQPAGI